MGQVNSARTNIKIMDRQAAARTTFGCSACFGTPHLLIVAPVLADLRAQVVGGAHCRGRQLPSGLQDLGHTCIGCTYVFDHNRMHSIIFGLQDLQFFFVPLAELIAACILTVACTLIVGLSTLRVAYILTFIPNCRKTRQL